MNVITMQISQLSPPESNVRIHSPQQIREFIRSLDQFGQTRLAVIDEDNTILIGNGMVAAMKERGDTTVECYRKEGLTENQKKKLMISDNKIFSLGIDDLDTLNSFIEDLKDDLDVPGYSEEVLESMVATAAEITETLSEYGTLDDSEIEAIKENGKRKEEQIAKIQQSESSDSHVPPSKATESPSEEVAEPGAPQESGSCVICPNCGEKIWL